MKKIFDWQVALGIILVIASAVVYYIHFLIFRDAHHIFLYLIGDIAFVFIEVLMVTLIIHKLLSYREKKSILAKLNMVIGAFFSEMGTELLDRISNFDKNAEMITSKLNVDNKWDKKDFNAIRKYIRAHQSEMNCTTGDIEGLRKFLLEKREFILRLLENPNLLEHDTFTNLLWAVLHLTEELAHRKSLCELPDTDFDHLANDIKRAYVTIATEWLDYMQHLKTGYPYLFSLAIRTNPFNPNAQIEVR